MTSLISGTVEINLGCQMSMFFNDDQIGIDLCYLRIDEDAENNCFSILGPEGSSSGYMKIIYNQSSIMIVPGMHHIEITGNYDEAIIGLARHAAQQNIPMVFQDTLTFSNVGVANYDEWTINEETIQEFANNYNKIFPAVQLLR